MHETRQVIFNGGHTKRDTSTKHNAHKGATRARPYANALSLYPNYLRSGRRTYDGLPESVRIGGMGCIFFRFAPANLAPATVYTRGIFFEKAKTEQTE